ncbi:hypothetical protein AB0758_32875 [Tolypothrix bouteillei VB521301_2]|uniref:hypothetical protein n=1 Tax=Tolypothrix bouteillei TaxID=1246981 RepID=UPI000A551C34
MNNSYGNLEYVQRTIPYLTVPSSPPAPNNTMLFFSITQIDAMWSIRMGDAIASLSPGLD